MNICSTDVLPYHASIIYQESFLTRDAKRQKKLSYGLSGEVLRRTGYSQIIPHNLAVSDCNEEPKFKENSTVIPPPAIFDASDVNGNVCAFCLSSKITDVSVRPKFSPQVPLIIFYYLTSIKISIMLMKI